MAKSKATPRAVELLQSTRPRQWVKNILVLTVPLAAGSPRVFSLDVLVTVVSFILVSGGLYTLNDILDRDVDIHNPEKTNRPVTSGKISPKTGSILAGVCVSLGLTAAYTINVSVFSILLLYALLVGSYSIELKKLSWLEAAIVATGFVLRMLAGGLAVSLPISRGFLVISFFGAALIVLGKRCSELVNTSASHLPSRTSLSGYSVRSLSLGMYFSLFAATSTYARMGVLRHNGEHALFSLYLLSSIPMTLAGIVLVRESFVGKAESLDRLLVTNRLLAALVALWTALFVAASFAGAH